MGARAQKVGSFGHWQDTAWTALEHLSCPNSSISYELNGACNTLEIQNTRMVISIASKVSSQANLKLLDSAVSDSESTATCSRPGSHKSILENPRSEVYEHAESMGLVDV